jgi:hypothetical protein
MLLDAPFVLSWLQLAGWALAIAGMVAAAAFVIWCLVTAVLWAVAHRRGDDVPQPLAAEGWFDRIDPEP